MTESNEPLWVGIDVDAELARYAEEDRRRALSAEAIPPPNRRYRRRGLSAALPRLAKGGSLPQSPLAA
jgi:hypothetical protein